MTTTLGITVQVWTSEIDGQPVVQIDTDDDADRLRVFLNDGRIYGSPASDDERTAQDWSHEQVKALWDQKEAELEEYRRANCSQKHRIRELEAAAD